MWTYELTTKYGPGTYRVIVERRGQKLDIETDTAAKAREIRDRHLRMCGRDFVKVSIESV